MNTNYNPDETNGLVDGAAYHDQVDYSRQWSLSEVAAAKGRITRLRLLAEVRPGTGWVVDVSYINATLPDGRIVAVQNGLNSLTPLRSIKGELINWAKREGVFAKGVGLLDEGSWSILR